MAFVQLNDCAHVDICTHTPNAHDLGSYIVGYLSLMKPGCSFFFQILCTPKDLDVSVLIVSFCLSPESLYLALLKQSEMLSYYILLFQFKYLVPTKSRFLLKSTEEAAEDIVGQGTVIDALPG